MPIQFSGHNLESEIIADYLALNFHKTEAELQEFIYEINNHCPLDPVQAIQQHYDQKILVGSTVYSRHIVRLALDGLNWNHVLLTLTAICDRANYKTGTARQEFLTEQQEKIQVKS